MFLLLETKLQCCLYHMGVNTHNCKIVICILCLFFFVVFFFFLGGGGGVGGKKSLTFAASLVLKSTLNKGLPDPLSPPAGGISALQRQYASQIQYS